MASFYFARPASLCALRLDLFRSTVPVTGGRLAVGTATRFRKQRMEHSGEAAVCSLADGDEKEGGKGQKL